MKSFIFKEMNVFNALKIFFLLVKHSKCQGCGSKLFGNGYGSFKLTEDYFVRTCKCGHKVEMVIFKNFQE